MGQGTFGRVYRSQRNGRPVALKVIETYSDAWELPSAIAEVSVFAMLEPHKKPLQLLDVEVVASVTVVLVFPLCERSPSKEILTKRTMMPEEVMHIATSLVAAL